MIAPGEQEQERVTPELDQPPAVPVRDRQQPGEDGSDHVADLLGSLSPLSGEPLRHAGEAGDVDEDDRAIHLTDGGPRCFGEPLDQQARHVRPQDDGCVHHL